MSLTTDITGGLFGPTEEEQKYLRQLGLLQERLSSLEEQQEAARQAKLPAKIPGTPHYLTPEGKRVDQGTTGTEMRHLTLAALQGRGLGEETSYGGQRPLTGEEVSRAQQAGLALGAGGEPVEVIRGRSVTYAGPRAGGEEYLTAGQARQAFRRELGLGEYVPEGAELTKAKAEATLSALRNQAKGALSPERYFEQYLTAKFGVKDEKTGETALPEYARQFFWENLPKVKSMEDARRLVDASADLLNQKRQEYDFMTRLNNPQTGAQMRGQMATEYLKRVGGRENAKQEVLDYIWNAPITPTNLQFFRNLMPAETPPPPPAPAPVPTAPRRTETPPEIAEGERLARRYEAATEALAGPVAPSLRDLGLGEGLRRTGTALFGTPESWQRASDLMRLAEAERRRREEERLAGGF